MRYCYILIFFLLIGYTIPTASAQNSLSRTDKIYKKDGQILIGKILKVAVDEVLIQIETERTSRSIPANEINKIVLASGEEIRYPIDEEYINLDDQPYQRKKQKSNHVENSAGVYLQGFHYDPSVETFNKFIEVTNQHYSGSNGYLSKFANATVDDPLELDPISGNIGFGAGFRYYTDPRWSIALSYSYMSTDTKDKYIYTFQGNTSEYDFRYRLSTTILGLTFRSNLLKHSPIVPILGGGFDIYVVSRKLELNSDGNQGVVVDAKDSFYYFQQEDARGVGITALAGLEFNLTSRWAVNGEAKYTFYGNATTNMSKDYHVEMDGWWFGLSTLYYFK